MTRLECARKILQLTREQLELVARDDDDEEMPELFEKSMTERAQLMAQIDSLSADLPPDAALSAEGQAYLETIRQCAALDEEVRRALSEKLEGYQEQVRSSRETHKGVQAYIGVQEQDSGIYFDKKN